MDSLRRISEVAVGVMVAAFLVALGGPLFSSPKVRNLDAEYLFKQDCLKRGGEIYEYAESAAVHRGQATIGTEG